MEGTSVLTVPFKCPLSNCKDIVSPSMILSHFLKEHQRGDDVVDFKEIQEKEKVSLMFTMTRVVMDLDENICLGILAYKMKISHQHSNAMVSREFQSYEHHLPIFIMTCRGNYVKMYDKGSDFIDPDADFIALWLVSPNVGENQKLFVTLTVHNEESTKSLSSLIRVRNASDSQDVCEFIDIETDFLIVNSGFLDDIANNGSIFTEIAIAENPL